MTEAYDELELVSDDYYGQLDLSNIISEYRRTRIEMMAYERMLGTKEGGLNRMEKSLTNILHTNDENGPLRKTTSISRV